MSVTGPDFVALQVHDVEQAADFYERYLGLRRAPSSPQGAVVFATTPIPFAVRRPLPGTELDEISPHPGAGVALWLAAEDVDELHEGLVRAGTVVLRAPMDGPFGRMFSFVDPDGYQITVHNIR